MRFSELVWPTGRPAADARIPVLVVRFAVAIVGTLLSLVVSGTGGWLAVGIVLAVLAAWEPDYLLAWVLMAFLAIGQLDQPATLTWQLLVLLAGIHLLHILASLSLLLPWHASVQPAVLTRPLLRFVAIQIPSQLFAVVALLLLAPNAHGHRPLTVPLFAAIGAAALAALALLLLRRRATE